MVTVEAKNNISANPAQLNYSINVIALIPVSIAWVTQPPKEVHINRQWNASLLVNGTDVTVIIKFGDGTEAKEAFFKSDQHNKVMNFLHR